MSHAILWRVNVSDSPDEQTHRRGFRVGHRPGWSWTGSRTPSVRWTIYTLRYRGRSLNPPRSSMPPPLRSLRSPLRMKQNTTTMWEILSIQHEESSGLNKPNYSLIRSSNTGILRGCSSVSPWFDMDWFINVLHKEVTEASREMKAWHPWSDSCTAPPWHMLIVQMDFYSRQLLEISFNIYNIIFLCILFKRIHVA